MLQNPERVNPLESVLPRRKNLALVLAAWFLLGVLALGVPWLTPPVWHLEQRPDWALYLLGMGVALILLSLIPRLGAARWIGAAVLWLQVALGLLTQVYPFGTPLGTSLGPQGILLVSAMLLWTMFLQPTGLVLRGALTTGVITLFLAGAAWFDAPVVSMTVAPNWVAVDSHDRVYSTETDLGAVWVFDPNGTYSTLWPRRARKGEAGQGLQPAGMSDFTQLAITAPFAADPLALRFCGLALDPQDQIYIIDPQLLIVQQFSPDGFQLRSWTLPNSFLPAQSCLAADSERVYVMDLTGVIYAFDHSGHLLERTTIEAYPLGMAIGTGGQLYVLKNDIIRVYQYPGGQIVKQIALSNSDPNYLTANGPILVLDNGDILASRANELREFDAEGKQVGMWGRPGTWPGQYAGPGGMPGEFSSVGGLAEDRQHRVYATDTEYRVIQRFRPDRQVDEVITANESETAEMRRRICPTLFCQTSY